MHNRSFIITINDNAGTWDVVVSVAPRNSNLVTAGRYGMDGHNVEWMIRRLAQHIASVGHHMPRSFLKTVAIDTEDLGGTWAP